MRLSRNLKNPKGGMIATVDHDVIIQLNGKILLKLEEFSFFITLSIYMARSSELEELTLEAYCKGFSANTEDYSSKSSNFPPILHPPSSNKSHDTLNSTSKEKHRLGISQDQLLYCLSRDLKIGARPWPAFVLWCTKNYQAGCLIRNEPQNKKEKTISTYFQITKSELSL